MKKIAIKIGSALLVICLLCAAVSCGASSKEEDSLAIMNQSAAQTGSAGAGGASREEIVKDLSENGSDAITETEYAPKIIKTAELSCETKSFDAAITSLEKLVAELGGYVQESGVTGRGYGATDKHTRSAEYTFRIPAESLDSFLASTGQLLNITSTTTSSEDVSADYYDIESRLAVLESERTLLQQMLSQTNDVSKMVTIEDRLYDVIYEIESYQTMLRVYDGRVAYSTVTLHLYEVADYTTMVGTKDSFGARIGKAFREGWSDFAQWIQDVCVAIVASLPALLLFALLATGGILIGRKVYRRRKAKKNNEEN